MIVLINDILWNIAKVKRVFIYEGSFTPQIKFEFADCDDYAKFTSEKERDLAWDKICACVELATNPVFTVPKDAPVALYNNPVSRPCTALTPKSPAQIKKKVIAHIISIRDEGNTYKYIADKLNSEGVATFSGKGKWYTQTVHKVVKG